VKSEAKKTSKSFGFYGRVIKPRRMLRITTKVEAAIHQTRQPLTRPRPATSTTKPSTLVWQKFTH